MITKSGVLGDLPDGLKPSLKWAAVQKALLYRGFQRRHETSCPKSFIPDLVLGIEA